MSRSLEEKAILDETPDLENQRKILQEEHNKKRDKKVWYRSIGVILFFVVLIITAAFSFLSTYVPIDKDAQHGILSKPEVGMEACVNVNLKTDDDFDINITDGDTCKPVYNVDYFNNRLALFNVDIYGDKSFLFNKINQYDNEGKCILNCDRDGDGWPEYNIDLNGDGTIDINKSFENDSCDIDCDINGDMIPDINIDKNGDNIPDINIDKDGDNIPDLNIDYRGNKVATFNVDNNNDGIPDENKVDILNSYGICTLNCDINLDGFPDYNIDLGTGFLINELVSSGKKATTFLFGFKEDWKCGILKTCEYKNINTNNKYINIDLNGDGIPDINMSRDGGVNLINPLNNKKGSLILNEDINDDGFPEANFDIDGDGTPDLNITDLSGKCISNCDINGDGKAEFNVGSGVLFNLYNINIDKDYDGKCDLNCDINGDLIPDEKLDNDGDLIPDSKSTQLKNENSITFEINASENNGKYFVSTPMEINLKNIKSGKTYNYEIIVNNKSNYATKFRIVLDDINSTFVLGSNIHIDVKRDNIDYRLGIDAPYEKSTILDNLVIARNSSFKYDVLFNYNVFPDDGNTYKYAGVLKIEAVE